MTTRWFLVAAACAAAWLLDPARTAQAGGEGDATLLERLSQEAASALESARAGSAELLDGQHGWPGALVGRPARFVIALDGTPEHGEPPATGQLRLHDGGRRAVRRIDMDGERGLAVYHVDGEPLEGLGLAGASSLRRGAFVLTAGFEPRLQLLGEEPLAHADLSLREAGDADVAVDPRGRLVALRAARGPAAAQGCAACHVSQAPTLAFRTNRVTPEWIVRWLRDPADFRQQQPLVPPGPPAGASGWSSDSTSAARPAHAWTEDPARDPWVPAGVMLRALEDIERAGAFSHAFLGIVYRPGAVFRGTASAFVEPLTPESLGDPRLGDSALGFLYRVQSVLPGSPAERAGLRSGQTFRVAGRPSRVMLARLLARMRPGEPLTLELDGAPGQPLVVTLGSRAEATVDIPTAASLGLDVLTLSPELVQFLGLPRDLRGVLVGGVKAGSAAALAGLRREDVIVDGAGPIRDAAELDAVLGSAKDEVLLGVQRGTERLVLKVGLPPPGAPRGAR